ncbi:hypothetical protein EDB87DRAFT_1582188 [Lactarius vividus]|nr:hypothetical protein EDB87DRAFT_1582188 [Lactarius vividus]
MWARAMSGGVCAVSGESGWARGPLDDLNVETARQQLREEWVDPGSDVRGPKVCVNSFRVRYPVIPGDIEIAHAREQLLFPFHRHSELMNVSSGAGVRDEHESPIDFVSRWVSI